MIPCLSTTPPSHPGMLTRPQSTRPRPGLTSHCFVTESKCTKSRYLYAFSTFFRKNACFVVYRNLPPLTWYEAATHCMNQSARLATFDTQNSADIDFVKSSLIPEECAWIGLVKKFFYWTDVRRTYRISTVVSTTATTTTDDDAHVRAPVLRDGIQNCGPPVSQTQCEMATL